MFRTVLVTLIAEGTPSIIVGFALLLGAMSVVWLRRWLGNLATTLAVMGFSVLYVSHATQDMWASTLRGLGRGPEAMEPSTLRTLGMLGQAVFALVDLNGVALIIMAFGTLAVRAGFRYPPGSAPSSAPAASPGAGSAG